MKEKRSRETRGGPESTGPSGGGERENRERVRREGEDLLAAADEAIQRVLSGDSAEFLAQSQQVNAE